MSLRRFSLQLISLVLLVTTVAGRTSDWSQWRGADRDGRVAEFSLPQAWPKTLKEQWRVNVGIGHSSPVLANGKIYIFARQAEEEVLMALDAVTGKELWRSAQPIKYEMNQAALGHGKGPKSTPLVSSGTVCTFGISGVISCHDTSNGKVKWRSEFSKLYPATSPLYGTAMSPIVENGLLIAHVGGQDKGALTAFELETGTVKWSNDSDGPAYASPIIATLAGVRQLVTATQKNLIGVDVANGKVLWQLPARAEYDTNSVTPVSYKDMIVLAREGKGLSAIKVTKESMGWAPKEIWNNPETELYMNTPVLQGNILYALSVKQKGQFVAINADTGMKVWQSPGRMGENAAIVNLAGKALMVLTNDANLVVLPIGGSSFAPIANYTVATSPTWAHPLVIGNRVLVKDETSLISLLI